MSQDEILLMILDFIKESNERDAKTEATVSLLGKQIRSLEEELKMFRGQKEKWAELQLKIERDFERLQKIESAIQKSEERRMSCEKRFANLENKASENAKKFLLKVGSVALTVIVSSAVTYFITVLFRK